MAGYSETPLLKKLGLKPGSVMYTFQAPKDYYKLISPLPKDVTVVETLTTEQDFIHLFVTEEKIFKTEFRRSKKHLKKDGMLWISWPKKASNVKTDLDENKIKNFGLEEGLVDVKVCAVDDVWSGLKFVFRLKDR